jgi:DnaJ-class molecular chaperone
MNCQLKTLYEILEINQNSSIDEIKRGYRKQAIKWHPDKNINNKQIAEERFKEISLAYEILIDSDKKKDYDKMNFVRQKDLYDLIMSISKKNITNQIISFFYKNETEFKSDVNNLDFSFIMKKIKNKISDSSINDIFYHFVHQTIPVSKNNNMNKQTNDYIEQTSETCEDTDEGSYSDFCVYDNIPEEYAERNNINDIKITIESSLLDICNKNYKKISLKRKKSKKNFETIELIIPILNKYIIYKNLGDENLGDLIIKRNIKDDKFIIHNNFDLLLRKQISLFDYIYGFSFIIDFLGTKLDLKIIKLFNKPLTRTLENYGIPLTYTDSQRGNLIIKFEINYNDTSSQKQILKKYFSNN